MKFIKRGLALLFLVIGGFAITVSTFFIPVGGPELYLEFTGGGCGRPSGLPFSFVDYTKDPVYLGEPGCFGYDPIAFVANAAIWSCILQIVLYLAKKRHTRVNSV